MELASVVEIEKMDSASAAETAVHPAVAPVSYLLGRWRGQGQGVYPTINPFSYSEELIFSHPDPRKV